MNTKPTPIELDADQTALIPETCPRCKGHGAKFGDDGPCNLCDGNGTVYNHAISGDAVYSNNTDHNVYAW